MEKIKIANTDLSVPRIAIGCMRITERDKAGAQEFIDTALSLVRNGMRFTVRQAMFYRKP